MNTILIFVWIYAAIVAMSFWEAYVEQRNAWNKGKIGWELRIGRFTLPAYHFYVFWVMWPLLLTLPFVIFGWDERVFGVIVSAYFSGMVVEDIMWYVVNPAVKFREFFSSFSDYYPWVRISGRKVVPVGYVLAFAVSVASWLFFWR